MNTLSTSQIRGIYTGAINNWSEVGGINEKITPYKRNATSGSQVLMETLIVNDDISQKVIATSAIVPTVNESKALLS